MTSLPQVPDVPDFTMDFPMASNDALLSLFDHVVTTHGPDAVVRAIRQRVVEFGLTMNQRTLLTKVLEAMVRR